MKVEPFTIQLPKGTREKLETIAGIYGMRDTAYAVTILTRLADLKPEFALRPITDIPVDYFRPRPGRPPSGTRRPDTNADQPTSDHIA